MLAQLSQSNLEEIFPVAYPNDMTVFDGDPSDVIAIEETGLFSEKRWNEVDCSLFTEAFEVPFWFSPAAFHYFFPSIISCSLRNPSAVELCVDSALASISFGSDTKHNSWSSLRLSFFAQPQQEVLLSWIAWLAESPKFDIHEDVIECSARSVRQC